MGLRLGLEQSLAGVTFECDHPRHARSEHPIVVGGLDTAGMAPGQIDELVRSRVAGGEQLYELDVDAVARIGAKVVLTQDLCRVCALPAGDVATAMDRVGRPEQLVTLDPRRLPEVLDGALQVGSAADAAEAGRELRSGLQERLDRVADQVYGRDRPRVVVLEWTDPPFLAGHWVPDLVSAAGGESILADPGGRSVTSTWPAIGAADPDITVIAPCGFGLPDAVEYGRAVLDRLPARSAVWAIDAGGYVTRPGPRVVDGVEALAQVLHPDVVAPPPPGRVARLRP